MRKKSALCVLAAPCPSHAGGPCSSLIMKVMRVFVSRSWELKRSLQV